MSNSRKSPSTILSDIKKNARRMKRENPKMKQAEALDIAARKAGPYHDYQHAQKELSRAIAAMGQRAVSAATVREPVFLSDLDYDIQGFKRLDDPTWTVVVGEDVYEMNEQAGAPNGVCLYIGEPDEYGDFSQYGIAVPYRDLPEGVRQGVRYNVEGALREKLLRAEENAAHPQRLKYPPICAGVYLPSYGYELPGQVGFECVEYYDVRPGLGKSCTFMEMHSFCWNNALPEEWAPMMLLALAVTTWSERCETGKALNQSLMASDGGISTQALADHLDDPWLKGILREYGILKVTIGTGKEYTDAGPWAFQDPLTDKDYVADLREKLREEDFDYIPLPRRGLNAEGAGELALAVARHAKTWGDLAALNFYRQVSDYGSMGTGGVAEEVCAWVDDIEKKRLSGDWEGLFQELNGFRDAAESYVNFFGMDCKRLDELMADAAPLPEDVRLRLMGDGLIDLSEAPQG